MLRCVSQKFYRKGERSGTGKRLKRLTSQISSRTQCGLVSLKHIIPAPPLICYLNTSLSSIWMTLRKDTPVLIDSIFMSATTGSFSKREPWFYQYLLPPTYSSPYPSREDILKSNSFSIKILCGQWLCLANWFLIPPLPSSQIPAQTSGMEPAA